MEKVGQYFRDEALHQTFQNVDVDVWDQLLKENNCLFKSKLLFPLNRKASLIQQRREAFKAIDTVFSKCTKSVSDNFQLDAILKCGEIEKFKLLRGARILTSFLNCNNLHKVDMLAISVDSKSCIIFEFNRKFTQGSAILIDMQMACEFPRVSTLISGYRYLHLIDLQFYNEELLSILLKNTEATGTSYNHFIQIHLYHIGPEMKTFSLPRNIDILSQHAAQYCRLSDCVEYSEFFDIEGQCTDMTVSGSRKV